MAFSIQEMEQAILDLEEAAPSIRKVLDMIPNLKQVMGAIKVLNFGASVSFAEKPINKAPYSNRANQSAQVTLPLSGLADGENFTSAILNIMKEQREKMTPREIKAICLERGLITSDTARNKVPFTMYYLAKRGFLEGDGTAGYEVTAKGLKRGGS